jgi:hypothetical protein
LVIVVKRQNCGEFHIKKINIDLKKKQGMKRDSEEIGSNTKRARSTRWESLLTQLPNDVNKSQLRQFYTNEETANVVETGHRMHDVYKEDKELKCEKLTLGGRTCSRGLIYELGLHSECAGFCEKHILVAIKRIVNMLTSGVFLRYKQTVGTCLLNVINITNGTDFYMLQQDEKNNFELLNTNFEKMKCKTEPGSCILTIPNLRHGKWMFRATFDLPFFMSPDFSTWYLFCVFKGTEIRINPHSFGNSSGQGYGDIVIEFSIENKV